MPIFTVLKDNELYQIPASKLLLDN